MSEKKTDWIPITKWSKHFEYPTQGAMRNICAKRDTNGANQFLSMVHGRFYVNVERFKEWMDEYSKQNRR